MGPIFVGEYETITAATSKKFDRLVNERVSQGATLIYSMFGFAIGNAGPMWTATVRWEREQ